MAYKKTIKKVVIFFSFLFPLLALADSLKGKVISITDGDTLTVLDSEYSQYIIRLAAIDAPERRQAFGNKAKQYLADLCFSKTAEINVVDNDRYGRLVGFVKCDKKSANELLIENGFAWVYRKYAKGYEYLYEHESKAKSNKVGLWVDLYPIPPWEYRKSKR